MRLRSRLIPALTLLALAMAHPALAGPPLLCHPYDIGGARSLPWNGTHSWFDGQRDYRIAGLVDDTAALLTPATPVIVRMETLRRAVIYASANREVALALLQQLVRRAESGEKAGRPDPLALLDAAYAAEALHEISQLREMSPFRERAAAMAEVAKTANGPALMARALAARPDDPTLHFAAALIAADNNRAAYEEHKARAAAGQSRDALLARNIAHVN